MKLLRTYLWISGSVMAMPNHFGDAATHYVTTSSPVGTQIAQAVGAAWAR